MRTASRRARVEANRSAAYETRPPVEAAASRPSADRTESPSFVLTKLGGRRISRGGHWPETERRVIPSTLGQRDPIEFVNRAQRENTAYELPDAQDRAAAEKRDGVECSRMRRGSTQLRKHQGIEGPL